MDFTMTVSNADNSILESIKEFIAKLSPKVSVSVEELYPEESVSKSADEIALEERRAKVEAAFGCLSQYANPKLQKKEKDAWAMAMREKYGVH